MAIVVSAILESTRKDYAIQRNDLGQQSTSNVVGRGSRFDLTISDDDRPRQRRQDSLALIRL